MFSVSTTHPDRRRRRYGLPSTWSRRRRTDSTPTLCVTSSIGRQVIDEIRPFRSRTTSSGVEIRKTEMRHTNRRPPTSPTARQGRWPGSWRTDEITTAARATSANWASAYISSRQRKFAAGIGQWAIRPRLLAYSDILIDAAKLKRHTILI